MSHVERLISGVGCVLSLGSMALGCGNGTHMPDTGPRDAGTTDVRAHDGAADARDAMPPADADAGAIVDASPGDAGMSGTAASACPVVNRAIPADAFLVAVTDRANLQAMLDAHANVRLESGDYATGGPAEIRIRSGHGVYAGGRTAVPRIVIPAGTANAVVSGVNAAMRFEAGTAGAVTRDNCFQHMSSLVTGIGVALTHNEFVDFHQSSLSFDTSAGGFMRNNRFVRVQLHGGYDAAIRLIGDTAHRSHGNVVFWVNALSAPLDTVVAEHQRDLTIVGADGENYGTAAPGAKAMIYTRDIGSLRINTSSGRVITPAFDLGANDLMMFAVSTETTGVAPRFTLQPGVARAALIDTAAVNVDMTASPDLRLRGLGDLHPPVFTLNGMPYTAPPASPALATALHDLIAPTRAGRPWARPALPAIPDPAGPGWNANLAARPDDAPALQRLIDTQHVVQLEPRAYYLASSLQFGASDGLIGAGADRTVLIARTPGIDLITTRLPPLVPPAAAQSFAPMLADLTLQGGRNGFAMMQPGTQMTIAYLDHVTFRNMSNAGILGDHVYGVDNNMFAYVNFYECASGFKMRTATGPADDFTPDLGYLDKTVFYRNQFVRCGTAVDVVGRRQNNLNVWFESSFRESGTTAFHSEPDASTLLASCEFIDNHGNPVIETSTEIINSYFRADANGTTMVRSSASIEGSTFERGTSTTATLINPALVADARDAPVFYMFNSRSDIPVGAIDSAEIIALFVNNSLAAADARWAAPMVLNSYDTRGTPFPSDDTHMVYSLLPAVTATPGSQLLFEDAP